jgi:ABC-type sugar transport system permease subunit
LIKESLGGRIWKMRTVYLFISPFFLLFVVFQLFPLIWSFYLSFFEWNGLKPMQFVGLSQYKSLLVDKMFLECLKNTFIYWGASLLFVIPLALILASAVNNPRIRGAKTFQTILFLPYVSAAVAVGLVFYIIFDFNSGLLNNLLVEIGLQRVPWLTSTKLSKIPVIVLCTWRVVPWYMLIFYSGLQSIDRDLFEAATIDGANVIQKLFRITIPSIAPIIFFCFINLSIESFRRFSEPYILTRGGPATSSMSLVQYLYNSGFVIFKLGYASAIGYALTFILIIISGFQLRLMIRQSREGER